MILRLNWYHSPSAIRFHRYFSQDTAKDTLRNGKYKSVIGLEVHAQIISKSKLFSGAANNVSAPANTSVSFFDASTPGTLPRLNRKCVESAVRTAMAFNCDLNHISMFDRKHYFYADSPAGYQITQQRLPLAINGEISFFVSNISKPYLKSSKIHQIQLEQDSGKSIHFPGSGTSLVDLNRAGVPLMEIVFEPDLTSGEEAASLLRELSLILTRLEVCSCKAGAFRCDCNISIHKPGESLGIRSEVKNVASIRAVAKAIEFEIARHIEVIESGGQIVNETRAWDEETGTTIRMRDKEVVQDYRFLPEPNLPPLNLSAVDLDALRDSLPELPDLTRDLLKKYNLNPQTTQVLVKYTNLLNLFLRVVEQYSNEEVSRIAANLIRINVLGACNSLKINAKYCPITLENFKEIIDMLLEGKINSAIVEDVILAAVKTPTLSSRKYVEENNRTVIRDPEELRKICTFVIENYDKIVRKAKRGKPGEYEKVVKAVLKESKRRADLQLTKPILDELLKSSEK